MSLSIQTPNQVSLLNSTFSAEPLENITDVSKTTILKKHLDNLKSHFYKILDTKGSYAYLWQNVKKELKQIKPGNINHLTKEIENPKEQTLFSLMLKAGISDDKKLETEFFKKVKFFKNTKNHSHDNTFDVQDRVDLSFLKEKFDDRALSLLEILIILSITVCHEMNSQKPYIEEELKKASQKADDAHRISELMHKISLI